MSVHSALILMVLMGIQKLDGRNNEKIQTYQKKCWMHWQNCEYCWFQVRISNWQDDDCTLCVNQISVCWYMSVTILKCILRRYVQYDVSYTHFLTWTWHISLPPLNCFLSLCVIAVIVIQCPGLTWRKTSTRQFIRRSRSVFVKDNRCPLWRNRCEKESR